jgi:lysophospholipase L1-like esterase
VSAAIAVLSAGDAIPGTQNCDLPPDWLPGEAYLPKTAEALKSGGPVKIVAIGGGSTAGVAAGGSEFAYPERLAVALRAKFPKANIVVINKGVARETAQAMLKRLERDAVAERPILVVWETGIADAVTGVEVDDFRETVDAGVQKLQGVGIETMLVDTQFSRRTDFVISFERYNATLREIADIRNVPLFPRHDLMRTWAEYGVFHYNETAEKDRRAMIVRVYDCIGRAAAEFIVRAFPPPSADK